MFDHTSEWHLVDVTEPDVKIFHGECSLLQLFCFCVGTLHVPLFYLYTVRSKLTYTYELLLIKIFYIHCCQSYTYTCALFMDALYFLFIFKFTGKMPYAELENMQPCEMTKFFL